MYIHELPFLLLYIILNEAGVDFHYWSKVKGHPN